MGRGQAEHGEGFGTFASSQGVLGQVELAALPRHAGELRRADLFEPGVIVADSMSHAVQAAVLQRRDRDAAGRSRLRLASARAGVASSRHRARRSAGLYRAWQRPRKDSMHC
jgi:hypothetical protein